MKRIFLSAALLSIANPGFAAAWSGPYAGIFAAGSRLAVQSEATAQRGAMGFGIGAVADANAMTTSMTYTDTVRKEGLQPGVYTGYLWTRGSLVYGLEADLQDGQKSRARGLNRTALVGFSNTQDYEYQQDFNVHYLATLRGRFGYAQENWLVYLTGGVAHAKISTVLNSHAPLNGPAAPPPIFPTSRSSQSGSTTGWVAGLGAEMTVAPQLRVRAEYLYTDLGQTTVEARSVVLHGSGDLFTSANGKVKSDWTSSSVRLGVSYAF